MGLYNIDGTYRSLDGTVTLTITNSNAHNGTFGGTYSVKDTPQGEQTLGVTGGWSYVDAQHEDPPIPLWFNAWVRGATATGGYVILDTWTGNITAPGRLRLGGVRSYQDAKGEHQLHSLEIKEFKV